MNIMSYKEKILELRENGLSYNKITEELGCSKATVSYHCKRWGLEDIGLSKVKVDVDIDDLNNYYKTHTLVETMMEFNISKSTIIRLCNNKRIKLDNNERKKRNYQHVKTRRQKIKRIIVEEKGGE